jgi:MFS family permease
VLLRVYMGSLSDAWGRKLFYSVSLCLCSLGTGLNAFFASMWQLTGLRTLREGAVLVRDMIHPILLYESVGKGFMNLIGKARGLEFLFMAGGTLLAGVTFKAWGDGGSLLVAGILVMAAFLFFSLTYGERRRQRRGEKASLRGLFSLAGLSPELRTVAWAGVFLWMGSGASHSFIMQLFFVHKFGASLYEVRWVMFLHRLLIVAPLMLVGHLRIRDLRTAYMVAVIGEGLSLIGATLMPTFLTSAAVWLLHDFVGGGIWSPIQHTLIQRYSRDESRGHDVSKALALMALGGAVGPYLAGMTAGILIDLPFAISGVLMLISVLPIFGLEERTTRA